MARQHNVKYVHPYSIQHKRHRINVFQTVVSTPIISNVVSVILDVSIALIVVYWHAQSAMNSTLLLKILLDFANVLQVSLPMKLINHALSVMNHVLYAKTPQIFVWYVHKDHIEYIITSVWSNVQTAMLVAMTMVFVFMHQ